MAEAVGTKLVPGMEGYFGLVVGRHSLCDYVCRLSGWQSNDKLVRTDVRMAMKNAAKKNRDFA